MLLGDLSAPKWKVLSGGKIQVESKDDIRARLGRSTDDGDAVAMAFWLNSVPHTPNARRYAVAAELDGQGRDPRQRRMAPGQPERQRADGTSTASRRRMMTGRSARTSDRGADLAWRVVGR